MIDLFIITTCVLTAILFPLGQLARISLFNQHINTYAFEITYTLFVIFLFTKYRVKPFKIYRKLASSILIFFLTASISFLLTILAYTSVQNGIGLLYLLRLGLYLISLPYVMVYAKDHRTLVLRCYTISLILVLTTSFVQYIFYPNLRNLIYLGWDPHLFRVFGTFFEPYLAATVFGILFFYLLILSPKTALKKIVRYICIFLFLLLIFLTFSRTTYLAILISTVAYLVMRKKWIHIILFLALCFTIIALIPKPVGIGVYLLRTFSIETRLINSREGITMWINQPIFGVGYNRIQFARAPVTSSDFSRVASHAASSYHSSFVTILVATGITGLLAFLFFLYEVSKTSSIAPILIVFVSLISMGDNALLHPFVLYVLVQTVALGVFSHPLNKSL